MAGANAIGRPYRSPTSRTLGTSGGGHSRHGRAPFRAGLGRGGAACRSGLPLAQAIRCEQADLHGVRAGGIEGRSISIEWGAICSPRQRGDAWPGGVPGEKGPPVMPPARRASLMLAPAAVAKRDISLRFP